MSATFQSALFASGTCCGRSGLRRSQIPSGISTSREEDHLYPGLTAPFTIAFSDNYFAEH